MIKIQVDAASAISKLDAAAVKLGSAAKNAVETGGNRLLSIVQGKLSGEVLNTRSGALLRSIRIETVEDENGIGARVYSDGSIPYARIQEYGGRVNVPAIAPVHAKALAFAWDGRLVFAKSAAAHVVDIPERSYLRTSLGEFEAAFAESMHQSVADAVT